MARKSHVHATAEEAAQCPTCGAVTGRPITISAIKKKDGGFMIVGRAHSPYSCAFCFQALHAIRQSVPIEVNGLVCECSSTTFDFVVESISAGKKTGDWNFILDVNCHKCHRKRLSESILGFLRLKRIRVGPTGVSVEMK